VLVAGSDAVFDRATAASLLAAAGWPTSTAGLSCEHLLQQQQMEGEQHRAKRRACLTTKSEPSRFSMHAIFMLHGSQGW
jgi:hypothetical protein